MSKIIVCLIMAALTIGCAASSYVQQLRQANYAPGFEPERRYVEKIGQKFDEAMQKGDPVEDYWDKVILLPLEPYIQFNGDWMQFLDSKAKEYTTVIIPKCEKIIRNGFTQISVEPRERAYSSLRAEFVLGSMGNINDEELRTKVFAQLNETIVTFFEPIMTRATSEAEQNQEQFSKAVDESKAFWQSYKLLHNYETQEQGKLRLRVELDKKYAPILLERQKQWEDSVSKQQKEQYAVQQVTLQDGSNKEYVVKTFLRTLSPAQYALLERQLYLWHRLEQERQIFKRRLEKYSELATWLKENSPRAEASFSNEMRAKQVRAARMQAAAMMLLGAASMVNAYSNWQNSYYKSYQVIGNTRHFQLYDQFGRSYYGTIR